MRFSWLILTGWVVLVANAEEAEVVSENELRQQPGLSPHMDSTLPEPARSGAEVEISANPDNPRQQDTRLTNEPRPAPPSYRLPRQNPNKIPARRP